MADYRYAIPDASGNGAVHPVLYVAGYGGVFRSLDNGQTWTVFPNTAFDSAPVDGGYLPSVDVTSLQLNLGAINPATGHATQVAGDPEVLLASTLGRGDFAIRLAPDVFPSTVGLDPTLPAPGGSDSGAVRGYPDYTNVSPAVHRRHQRDLQLRQHGHDHADRPGQRRPSSGPARPTPSASSSTSIRSTGLLVPGIQLVNTGQDPSFFTVDGVKTVGIQATDSSGAKGNVTTFTYNLKTTPPPPPTNLTLANDSGRFTNDDITNVIPPIFTVATTEPAHDRRRADPVQPEPCPSASRLRGRSTPSRPTARHRSR